ncbi:hypothetical protein OHS58_12570 [Amycolatopsis sp. NBC_00348]|uniref:hypothetical protein n=1 Tax=Amycolatopsis sp. NBC_00348 TaxID=2975956 RepID=UPI002E25A249
MTAPCPSCGQLDQVQHVPAVYYGGHSYYRGQGPTVAVPAGDGVIYTSGQVSGVTVTGVARALDPFPPRRRAGGLVAGVVLLLMVGSCFLWLPFSAVDDPPPGGAGGLVLGFALLALPSVCVFGGAGTLIWLYVRRVREYRRRRAGIPAAQALWEQGWFCHRCGGVYLAQGPLMAPARFRELVGEAGGY